MKQTYEQMFKQPRRNQMGYHDRQPPDYERTGMGVVNPLMRIEKKLKKIQEILDNISDSSVLTATDLKIKIEQALAE